VFLPSAVFFFWGGGRAEEHRGGGGQLNEVVPSLYLDKLWCTKLTEGENRSLRFSPLKNQEEEKRKRGKKR
jgi:hypothetical protein